MKTQVLIGIILLIILSTIGCDPGHTREVKTKAQTKREQIEAQKRGQSPGDNNKTIERNQNINEEGNNDNTFHSKTSINIKPNNYKFECPDFAKAFLESLKEVESKKLPPTATRGDEWNAIFTLQYCPRELAAWIDSQCLRMSYSLAGETNVNWVVLDSLISGKVVTSPLFK